VVRGFCFPPAQQFLHIGKGRLGQPMALQQLPEVQDPCRFRDAVIAQLDPG